MDKILADLKAITYDPRDHKGERLFRLSDIKKILTAHEGECSMKAKFINEVMPVHYKCWLKKQPLPAPPKED